MSADKPLSVSCTSAMAGSRLPEGRVEDPETRISSAAAQHLEDVIVIHRAAFPGFFMTRLGSRFLRKYYRLVLAHPDGVLLVATRAGRCVGFVAGFLDPSSFYAEMRRQRISFATACVPALIRNPLLAWKMVRAGRRVDVTITAKEGDATVAELSSIGVRPGTGRRGVGRELLQAFITRSREMGAGEIRLTTDAEQNDAVNRFYVSAGFRLGRSFAQGRERRMNEYVYHIERVRGARRASFLPFSPPNLGPEEIAEVVDTLESDWISTGPKTRLFEGEMAAYLGAPQALALNSCTAGLHLALASLGIGPGDEVVTTPMTFAASVNVIEHVGATPVLVDVEPDTLNIDPSLVERAITDRTRAILPVHFAGHPVEMDTLDEMAARFGLSIVEDAAHALPARYKGRLVGSGPHLTAFSFYATKNMTTGEGGLLTGDAELLGRARALSLHGLSRDAWKRYDRAGSWYYEVVAPGFKYNMSDLQASIGLQQIKKLNEFQDRRTLIVDRYNTAFSREPCLEAPVERMGVNHAWHLYVLRLREDQLVINRDRFIEELKERNIATSVHFIPIHAHPYYRDKYSYQAEDFPNAWSNYRRMLSLPIYPRMTDQDVDDVIHAVLDVVDTFRA